MHRSAPIRTNRREQVSRALRCALQAASALAIASCGGGAVQIDARYVTLHNTMAAMGLVQSGEISQGSLAEGTQASLRVPMRPGDCYTVVGIGGDGVADLDVVVRDPSGQELARDRTQESQAATQFCPPYPGEYEVLVHMTRGNGGYLVTAWSGGRSRPDADYTGTPAESVAAARPPHGGPGTCEQPLPLSIGAPVRGDTHTGDAVTAGSCVGGGDAPEHVYALSLDQRSMVNVVVNSSFDATVYLLGACGEQRSEIACNDDSPSTSRSEIAATLEPGLYYVVVDGFGSAAGDYELTATSSAMQTIDQVCGAAPLLAPGQPVAGTTQSAPDYFQATCAGQARSGDRVYALDVAQPSRLRVRMQSTHDGAIYVRSDCDDAQTEIACNDDYNDVQHSLLTTAVEPGRYYVFADGFGSGANGDYTLSTELGPRSGGGAPGDTCQSAVPATAGQALAVDTFSAADDFAGSCGGQGAPDVVYRLELRSRSRVRGSVASQEFAGAMYIQSACGGTEVFCTQTSSGTSFDQNLAAGTYFVVVDGQGADAFGASQVSLMVDDLGALEQACRSAPAIRPGRQVVGDTSASTDRYQATCADGARSADLVYRLQLRRRQHVRISSEQTDFDGAIYVRSDCNSAGSEVACNDDAGDNHHSMIEVTLDPGTYYVIVDGFSQGNQGRFTLDVDLTNP